MEENTDQMTTWSAKQDIARRTRFKLILSALPCLIVREKHNISAELDVKLRQMTLYFASGDMFSIERTHNLFQGIMAWQAVERF